MSSANNTKPELGNVPIDDIPSWLNEQFFCNILQKENKNELKVKIVSIKPAVGVGENYSANIYRVAVQVQEKTQSFIVKYFKGDVESIIDFPMFPNEIKMYSEILPALQNEFKQFGEEVKFGPKCYLARMEPVPVIVLEDLRPMGYSVHDRFAGVDINHCKVFLTKLAKYHAASVVYCDKNKEVVTTSKTPYSYEYQKFSVDFIKSSFRFFVEAIAKNERTKVYADKIAKWESVAFDEVVKLWTADSNGFNVIMHSDCWINNFLFSYDQNKLPNDLLLIDYQVLSYGSPTLDLLYFYVSSTQNELVGDAEFDNLIQFYHTEFTNNLRKMEFKGKGLTLKQLQIDLLKFGFWGAYCCFFVLGAVLLPPRKDANMEGMFDESEKGFAFKRDMYQNPRYMQRLEKLLPFLDQKGLLDL